MVGFKSLIFKSHEATASSLRQIHTYIKRDESFFSFLYWMVVMILHFVMILIMRCTQALPIPWWWYSMEVTPSNLKPSKRYSSIHQRRLDNRNRNTSQLGKHTSRMHTRTHTYKHTLNQITWKILILTFMYWWELKLCFARDGMSITEDYFHPLHRRLLHISS